MREILSGPIQKKTRPPIEEMCGYLITNNIFNEKLLILIAMLKSNGVKFPWYQPCNYKVNYKGEYICQIHFGRGDNPGWWQWNEYAENWIGVSDKYGEYAMTIETQDGIANMTEYFRDKMTKIDAKITELANATGNARLSKLDRRLLEFPDTQHKAAMQKFIVWLKENKMTPQTSSPNTWKATYKGNTMCYLHFEKELSVEFLRDRSLSIDFDELLECAKTKDFIFSIAKQCTNCYKCAPGISVVINGQKLNVCRIRCYSPTESDIDLFIGIIERWKNKNT